MSETGQRLFEVEPQSRVVEFYMHTYKGNRVVSKMIKTLKENGTFIIEQWDDGGKSPYRIYRITIDTTMEYYVVKGELMAELELMLPELFTPNYQFNFTNDNLGFVNSFVVYEGTEEGDGEPFYRMSHRIKEIRTDGRSNMPLKQIIK